MFLDGTYHGEMKASEAFDADGYQYSIDHLSPGQTYDITVKVCACAMSKSISALIDIVGWASRMASSLQNICFRFSDFLLAASETLLNLQ